MTKTKRVAIGTLTLVLVATMASIATAVVFSSTVGGTGVAQVKSVRSGISQEFTDDGGATTSKNLGGSVATIKIPKKQKGILLIRFASDTACFGGITGGFDSCYVRALVNNKVARPGEVSFDNNNTNTESNQREAHSMDWSYGPVGPGTYTVRIQVRTDESPCCLVTFDLDHWTLTVERAAAA